MEGVVPKATKGRDGCSHGCAAGGLEGRGLVPDQVLQKYDEGRVLSRTEYLKDGGAAWPCADKAAHTLSCRPPCIMSLCKYLGKVLHYFPVGTTTRVQESLQGNAAGVCTA